jgi:Flp pilus assembly protein TadG
MSTRFSSKKDRSYERAQAIVEFAIALPILMFMLVGILEVGRMMFIYASVTNASREAARYASAVGLNDTGTSDKVNDCAGIRDIARRSAFMVSLQDSDIVITYDDGPGGSSLGSCPIGDVDSGQRVNVSISAMYRPMVNLIPIGARSFTSQSSRTILGIYELPAVAGGAGAGGGGGGPTSTFTATIAATATDTPTDTPTPKHPSKTPKFDTLTPADTATATNTVTPTSTSTPTSTGTATFTPTATITSTPTNTPVPGCGSIVTGTINTANNSPVISMTITNPHTAFTVTSVVFKWDVGNGANQKTLIGAQLGNQTWSLNDSSGVSTFTPIPNWTLPGNNSQTTIQFTLDRNYGNAGNGLTTITLNLSSAACGNISVTKTK